MATFNVGIGKDDIQEGILLPEDWYEMEISREPYEDKNSFWKGVETPGQPIPHEEARALNPKAGKNIVVNLRVKSDTPEFVGRSITKWLPLPGPQDENHFMNDGQPKADWKAETIYKWVEAFGGAVEGSEASLIEGQTALVYVIQGVGMDGETVENAISMNANPRRKGAGGSGLGAGEEIFAGDGGGPETEGLL